MHRVLLAAVAAGLLAGALSALARAHLDGMPDAFANSTSTWLVAPFLVGTLATSRPRAAAAGLTTCASQLVGYYVLAYPLGLSTAGSLIAFWTVCAVAGGPVFGLAGQLWRTSAPPLQGLGIAVLAGVFVAEGLYAYVHQLHSYLTGTLWIAIGLGLALRLNRGRVEHLRWLALTLPLGVAGEVLLTTAHRRFF